MGFDEAGQPFEQDAQEVTAVAAIALTADEISLLVQALSAGEGALAAERRLLIDRLGLLQNDLADRAGGASR